MNPKKRKKEKALANLLIPQFLQVIFSIDKDLPGKITLLQPCPLNETALLSIYIETDGLGMGTTDRVLPSSLHGRENH